MEDKIAVVKRIQYEQYSTATIILESIIQRERKIEVYSELLSNREIAMTTLILSMASQTKTKNRQTTYEVNRSKADAQILTALVGVK